MTDSQKDACSLIQLRPVRRSDLDAIFVLQGDAAGNDQAATIPRSRESFDEHWDLVLNDSSAGAYSIIVFDRLVGTIARYRMQSTDYVGYWIGPDDRGRGVATQALCELLKLHPERPLMARVAVSNAASVQVLQKNGFEIVDRYHAEATDRFLACEEYLMQLDSLKDGRIHSDGRDQ